MWNWLNDCYKKGFISLEYLEEALKDDEKAQEIWKKYSYCSEDFVDLVRHELKLLVPYIKAEKPRRKIEIFTDLTK